MWHHKSVCAPLQIVLRLLSDLIVLIALSLRQRRATAAEILVLRRQIALYKEQGIKPRRIDAVTRISLALLSRLFNWRDALVVVRPETMIRWHRAGWKLFWRLKSRPGRPPIPLEIRALIRRMANENPAWGEERIANEFLVKLGIRLSPRTVSKYLSRRPPRRPRGLALVDISAPSRSGNHCLRLPCCRHRHVPVVVRVRGDRAPQPAPDPLQRHRPSKCRLDAATAA